jgi:hypothetical protein
MSAAIHTKYIGPTLRRGGRIKAFCRGENRPGFTLTADYPSELHHDEKHASVAKALAEKLGWSGLWIVGGNFDGSIVCACVPGSYSRAWVDKYIPGKENADWFFISDQRGE